MKTILFAFVLIFTNLANALVVYPVGDSITRGIDNLGYRQFLYEDLSELIGAKNVKFVGTQSGGDFKENSHDGHNGWKISDLQENIQTWLSKFEPDVILLMIGANDIESGVSLKEMETQFGELLVSIHGKSPKALILVSEITLIDNEKFDRLAQDWNRSLSKIADAHYVQVVKMHDQLDKNDLVDLDHPKPSGNSKIAKQWVNAMTGANLLVEVPLLSH